MSNNIIGIHPVHRRLAEIDEKATRLGGYKYLPTEDQMDLRHCLIVSAKVVRQLDELKQMAFIAHQANDMKWQQELCQRIEKIEVSMI